MSVVASQENLPAEPKGQRTSAEAGRPYQVCTRCAMDTSVLTIRFNAEGACNFCDMHDEMEGRYPLNETGKLKLDAIIADIKASGQGKPYDCICGTSGGRDSSWVLYMAVRMLGLRPLVVHFDNGWNSAIAVRNIYNACRILDLDLVTYVVDWEEFKDLQKAFLKASTPDVEVPTDVAIHAVMLRLANQEGLRYVLNGHSFRTEGIAPLDWTYMDGRYIAAVQRLFGTRPITSFPNFSMWDYIKTTYLRRIKVVPILNFFPYDQKKVQEILERELKWTYYGGHHHESYYTKFIQSYLLPRKFNVDKRRTELSALIRSGYCTRAQALEELTHSYEFDPTLLDYTIEKLDFTRDEWQSIIDAPPKSFRDYPSYYPFIRAMKVPLWVATKLGLVDRLLYLKFLG